MIPVTDQARTIHIFNDRNIFLIKRPLYQMSISFTCNTTDLTKNILLQTENFLSTYQTTTASLLEQNKIEARAKITTQNNFQDSTFITQ